jgi:hypothetical protein
MNRENEIDQREPMNCLEFREVLHELDRHGTRGAAAFDSAMAHAECCGDCGALLVEEESLGFALQKVAQETSRMPGASRVEAELLNAFRQELKPATIQTIPARTGKRWGIIALGIAATVLLVLGTVIYQRNSQKTAGGAPAVNAIVNPPTVPTDSQSPKSLEVSAQNSVSNPAANPGVANSSASTTNSAVNPNTKNSVAANDADATEYATAFVPLPYADDPSALEGGSVVRVTLARSVLESYGLPAEGLGAGDRVTADMIVSEDGTPQAIRLVAVED